jgi:energy-coupling factor transport system substrate-specific component
MSNSSRSSFVSPEAKTGKSSGGSLVNSIRRDFNTLTWVLIPVAIAINVAIGQVVYLIKLPVYLDSVGTVLVGVLAGPWAGMLTGALTNIIWGLVQPDWLPWFPVAAAIGLVAGLCAKFGLFKTWWKVVVSGFLIALAAVIVGTPISVHIYGGLTGSGAAFITAFLLQTGRDVYSAVFSTNFLLEPVDKIATALLVFAIIQGLSMRYLARFPRPENVALEQQVNRRMEIYIAVGVFVLLVLVAAFVLVRILGE